MKACVNCGCQFEPYQAVVDRIDNRTKISKLKKTFLHLQVTTLAGENLPLCHECRVHLCGLYAEAIRQKQSLS